MKWGNASTQASVCSVIASANSRTFCTVSNLSLCTSSSLAYTSRKWVWIRNTQSASTSLMKVRIRNTTERIESSSAYLLISWAIVSNAGTFKKNGATSLLTTRFAITFTASITSSWSSMYSLITSISRSTAVCFANSFIPSGVSSISVKRCRTNNTPLHTSRLNLWVFSASIVTS